MRLRLLSVGRPRDALLIELHDRYADRLVRLGIDYRSEWVAEVGDRRYSDDHKKEREARSLVARIDPKSHVVALTPGGTQFDSPALGRRIEGWLTSSVTLVIGGPLGLHRSVLDRARTEWSLGRATLPHEWARALVCEQLYRGVTLARGLPYHK